MEPIFWSKSNGRQSEMGSGASAGSEPGANQVGGKELLGMYSNLVLIHHHAEEFTLNFVYAYPDGTQGELLSSMIVSPSHVKRIWRGHGENTRLNLLPAYPVLDGPLRSLSSAASAFFAKPLRAACRRSTISRFTSIAGTSWRVPRFGASAVFAVFSGTWNE